MIPRPCLLEALGEKHRATKRAHDYLRHYDRYFTPHRLSVARVLEIGVEDGLSLRMWEEYFPNAEIFGVDINPKSARTEGGRRRVIIGDQSDRAFVARLGAEHGPFDIVIDDGSHRPDHIQTTFEALAPCVTSHGFYCVEDVGGVTGDVQGRTSAYFQRFVRSINHWPEGVHGRFYRYVGTLKGEIGELERRIVGVSFYRWLIVLCFGRNPEDNPYLLSPADLTHEEMANRLRDVPDGRRVEILRDLDEAGYFRRHRT